MNNSKFNRRFTLQISESGHAVTVDNLTVERLTEDKPQGDDFEYIYALDYYGIDKILDLKIGESVFIQPNRDDNESKGILTRVK